MDLSRFKWPLIIIFVFLVGWLLTNPGVNFMHQRLVDRPVGESAEADKATEAGLTRLGWFLIRTFRYQKARQVLDDAIDLYPNGENVLLNHYRLAKVEEKLGNYAEAVRLLRYLEDIDAHSHDPDVPESSNLKLRADKIMEMHDLGEIQGY